MNALLCFAVYIQWIRTPILNLEITIYQYARLKTSVKRRVGFQDTEFVSAQGSLSDQEYAEPRYAGPGHRRSVDVTIAKDRPRLGQEI